MNLPTKLAPLATPTMPKPPFRNPKPINIGSLQFPTISAAQQHTRKELASIGYITVTNSHRSFPFLMDLTKNHPEHDTKFAKGIKKFEIQRNILNRKASHMLAVLKDGSRVDFSWKICCGSKPPNNLRHAMRQAVQPSIYRFRQHAPQVCALCGSTQNLQVDHDSPQFEELCQAFEAMHSMPTVFDDHPRLNMAVFQPKDEALQTAWIEYHDNTALLRMLCGKCNQARSLPPRPQPPKPPKPTRPPPPE